MLQKNYFKLILNSKEFRIPYHFQNLVHINVNILYSLINHHQYQVKSKVNEAIFQSFINFVIYNEIPEIQPNDIEEYYKLNLEFEFKLMDDLIQMKKEFNQTFFDLKNYEILTQNNKLKIIEHIARNLDDYLDHYGIKLMDYPIEILLNIFSYSKRKFTKHNLLYQLITEYYKKTNKIEIFSLLATIDSEKLSETYLKESILLRSSRNNQVPKINVNKLLDKIEKLEKSQIENKNNLMKIFTCLFKCNEIGTYEQFQRDSNKLFSSCTNLNFNSVYWLTRKEFTNESGITFKINEDDYNAAVSNVNDSNEAEIVIPKSITYSSQTFLVTDVIHGSFTDSKNIKSVKFDINSKLSIIGEFSFANSLIECVVIPKSVKIIERYAFYYCNSLKTVTIPQISELKIIDSFAFNGSSIESIIIPNSVTEIGENSFRKCLKLKTVDFYEDSNLQIIDKFAFGESSIERITIPRHVIRIGENAFYNCKQMKKIEIHRDSELEFIDRNAFDGSSIESISIPYYVSRISESALSRCEQLKIVSFAENSNLRSILGYTFYDSSIESISLSLNEIELMDGWCYKLMNLKKFIIHPNNHQYIFKDDQFLIGKTNSESNDFDCLIFARRDIETANIPSNITRITSYAFSNCSKLQCINFPDDSKLRIIDQGAFQETSIKSINIPPHVAVIKNGAFSLCMNLKSIKFSENSEPLSIYLNAFYGSPVESIFIPSSKIEFKDGWCCKLLKLTKFIVSPNNHQYVFKDDQFLIGKTNSESDDYDCLMFAQRNIEIANIPSNITRITSYAFSNCSKLQCINFPDDSKLRIIEQNAFNCSSIRNIKIPTNVVEIGEASFSECESLKRVELPNNPKLIQIAKQAFAYSSIVCIIIPPQITRICESAFSNCRCLREVYFTGKSKLQMIDKRSFPNSSIERITIPRFVKKIHKNAFFDCRNLKRIDFEENSELSEIGKFAFSSSSIDGFFIPKNVVTIGENAFHFCDNLKIVEISEESKLKSLDRNIFYGSSLEFVFIPVKSKNLQI